MTLFAKVSSQKLRDIAEVLGSIHATKHSDLKLALFARTLSCYIRCELSRRSNVTG